jgi:hypothetical protein
MRDIRNDLQERVRLIEDQISSSYAQFEKMIEQLQSEREARVSELKSELSALGKLMEVEHRRMANVLPLQTPAAPEVSLADFILQRLGEMGPMSKDDLVDLTLKERLFDDGESADRAVHTTLVNIIRSEHLRQLHDGTFVPNTAPQAIRLRRA